ncbi:hypothetical protein C8250_026735 [Streptomyces sp. So13.3]|uniref:Uncharacterized protein n=1 Tax=Streptomyces fildesensis TaxID=375757 RepID=A0ABW8C2G5_9ACTN|nr:MULTISPECIES: hypothetical protein [unclassified Streptomyces]MCM2421285.1 hypothetical protein [Streptomyces sp. RKAG293]MCM2426512.1 hypothetical protein [Streptomyces sp. RKAG337]QNA75009.1 hypothetical protein C8250_026735 [Streptomyces sp. So13.3]
MMPPDRKEEEVRRVLDTPHPYVPADLAERAAERGRRILRRRRVVHQLLWLLLVAAIVTGVVFAVLEWPDPQPLDTTPPVDTW